MRRRLPSREIGVLMTTLVIQQRAGGDTVRALNELGHTLEARKDLMREIKTLLAGSVFTSYLVVGIGVATIVLLNLMSPGVMREMATSAPGLAALGVRVHAVVGGVRPDPAHDEGGAVTPLLAGALAALCIAVGLLGVPLRARPRAARSPGRPRGRRVRRAARRSSRRVVGGLAAKLGPRVAPSIRAAPARADRLPARPRGPARRHDRAALHRPQGRAGDARRRRHAPAHARRRRRCCSSCPRCSAAGSAPTSGSRARAACGRSGSSATCRTSSTSSP